jgi:hypothetical protein
MRCLSLVLVLSAGLGGVAAAQPGPPPQPPPPPVDTTTTTTTTVDPAPPQPEPARVMPVVQEEQVDAGRPQGLSIGLGLGYGLPTSLETPNRTSARLRLASGLTFEPLLSIANTSETMDTPTMETTSKTTELGLAVLVRLPFISRGKVDLEGLATAGFTNTKVNPDGDYNTQTTNTFGVGWGVGIGYWLSQHWQLSMSVTNPLVTYDSTKQQTGPGMSSKDGETTIGVIFVPQVTAMIHLYN